MTPELQKQIEQEGKESFPDGKQYSKCSWTNGYITGATPYAEKVEQLEQEVERLKTILEKAIKDFNISEWYRYDQNDPRLKERAQAAWDNFKQIHNL